MIIIISYISCKYFMHELKMDLFILITCAIFKASAMGECEMLGCKDCTNTSWCKECSDGFQLADGTCRPCPNHCVNCSSAGRCFKCKSGFFSGGYTCQPCPEHCSKCRSHWRCDECDIGFYSDRITCQPCPDNSDCTLNCPEHCRLDTCIPDSKECGSCEAGFYGLQCDATCPENCWNRLCDQAVGQCTSGCETGHFGIYCNDTSVKEKERLIG